MKRIAGLALAMLTLWIAPAPAAEPTSSFGNEHFSFGIEGWMIRGDQVHSGGPLNAGNRYEITHPIDTIMASAHVEFRFFRRWGLRAAYGFGSWDDGTMTDTDWDAGGRLWYLSTSKVGGDTRRLDADVLFRIYSSDADSYLDLAVGYRNLKNEYEFSDAYIILQDYVTLNTGVTGTWNRLDTQLHAWQVGLRGQIALHPNVALRGFLGFSPYLYGEYRATRYPGTGYENYESVDPEGRGVEASASLIWRPYQRFSLELGYRYLKWDFDGDENPGSSFYGLYNDFELTLDGVFAAAAIHF